MPSELKQQTARRNGAMSNGPVTEEGKARSSQNAITHGLTSRTVVLANESPEKYARLLEAYCAEWQPTGQTETDLVVEIANCRWRLRRIWAIETAAIDSEMFIQRKAFDASFTVATPNMRQADALQYLSGGDNNFLNKLDRYETRYRRGFDRALNTLVKVQSYRGFEAPNLDALRDPTYDPTAEKSPQMPENTPEPSEPAAETPGLLARLLLLIAMLVHMLRESPVSPAKSTPKLRPLPRNFSAPRFDEPGNCDTEETFHFETHYSRQAETA